MGNQGLGNMGRVVEGDAVLVNHRWVTHYCVRGKGGRENNTEGEQTTKKWEADEHAKR